MGLGQPAGIEVADELTRDHWRVLPICLDSATIVKSVHAEARVGLRTGPSAPRLRLRRVLDGALILPVPRLGVAGLTYAPIITVIDDNTGFFATT